ncbi:MAG: type II CRISPR RNA-guided endonuclease Cas9 [Candidatus Dojkabacteria bacterium]|nr:type II CRISPR RNA-guided endonuclease Cas9 [Candidatus Dojkabacteria bacterium]
MNYQYKYVLSLNIQINNIGWSIIEIQERTNNQNVEIIPLRIIRIGVREFDNPTEEIEQIKNYIDKKSKKRIKLTNKIKEFLEQVKINLPTKYTSNPYKIFLQATNKLISNEELSQVILYIAKGKIVNVLNHKKERAKLNSHHVQDFVSKDINQTKNNEFNLNNIDLNFSVENIDLLKDYSLKDKLNSLQPIHNIINDNKNRSENNNYKIQFLVEELKTILESQQKFGNAKLTDEVIQTILNIFKFRSKPNTKDEKEKFLGRCQFFKKEKRALRLYKSSDLFVLWQKINSLKLVYKDKEKIEVTKLNNDQRKKIFEKVNKIGKLTYTEIRKCLKLPNSIVFYSLLNAYDKKQLNEIEDTVFVELKSFNLLKKIFYSCPTTFEKIITNENLHDKIIDAIYWSCTDIELIKALEKLELNLDEIQKILVALKENKNINATLHISKKAIKLILPFLEKGLSYCEAVEQAIPKKNRKNLTLRNTFLPCIDIQKVKKAIFLRPFGQTRKLINTIIKHYGSPCFIHIKLSKDFNINDYEKEKFTESMFFYNERKESVENILKEEFKLLNPSVIDIIKYELWEEQNHKCAYSGEPIYPDDLFEYQNAKIDCIVPFSRTFDNTKSNLVLIRTSEHHKKGNKTPFEYFGNQQERWNKIRSLWESWLDTGRISSTKFRKLCTKQSSRKTVKDLMNTNLNDNRYLAKYIKTFIKSSLKFNDNVFKSYKKRIYTFNHILTNELKNYYGFKNNDSTDFLRESVLDSILLGIVSPSFIQELKRYYENREIYQKTKFPEPWRNFRDDVNIRIYSKNPIEELKNTKLANRYEDITNQIRPLFISKMTNKHIIQKYLKQQFLQNT